MMLSLCSCSSAAGTSVDISWSSSTLLLLLSIDWGGITYFIHCYYWWSIWFKSIDSSIATTFRVDTSLTREGSVSIRRCRLRLEKVLFLYFLFSSFIYCISDWRGHIHKRTCDLIFALLLSSCSVGTYVKIDWDHCFRWYCPCFPPSQILTRFYQASCSKCHFHHIHLIDTVGFWQLLQGSTQLRLLIHR